MASFISYYGHVQNTSHLGRNIFISHLFGSLVEVKILLTLLFNIYTLCNTHSLDSKLECPLHHQQARQKDLTYHVLPPLHCLQSRLWSHLLRLSPDQAGLGSDGQDDHRCRLLRVSAVREWADAHTSQRSRSGSMRDCGGTRCSNVSRNSLLGKSFNRNH